MNHVIVCVEKPKNPENAAEWDRWFPFVDELKRTPALTAGTQNPIENVWLFPLDNGLKALPGFLHSLQSRRLKHKILLLDNDPKICD